MEFKEFNKTNIPFALVGYETGYSQLGAGYLPSHIQRAHGIIVNYVKTHVRGRREESIMCNTIIDYKDENNIFIIIGLLEHSSLGSKVRPTWMGLRNWVHVQINCKYLL